MKFALVKTDYVNHELIPAHGDLPEMFRQLFAGVDLDVYEARFHRLPDPADYDACVMTGSRCSVNDAQPWIHALLVFLHDAIADGRSLIVGFCFGHHALAKALGGRVGRGPCDFNVGVWPVGEIGGGFAAPRPLHALFNHREQVVVPPPGAKVLAGTERCPVQMFAAGDCALGLQFHPEYTLAYQEALMGVTRGMPADVRADAQHRNRTLLRNDAIARDWVLELASRHTRGRRQVEGASA